MSMQKGKFHGKLYCAIYPKVGESFIFLFKQQPSA